MVSLSGMLERVQVWVGWLPPLLICVTLTACEAPTTSEGFRLDTTESGVPWARNSGSGSWGDAERWTVEIGLELGAVDGPGADVFGSIGSVAVGLDGKIFVLDGLAQEVKVFDASGSHLYSFGRRGDGPGEFRYADGLILDAEENVWVYDPTRARLLLFDGGGIFLRQISIDRLIFPSGPVVPRPSQVLPDGTLLGTTFINPGRDYTVAMGGFGSLDLHQPVGVNHQTGVVDTFPSIEVRVPTVGQVRVPLTGRIAVALDPDGSVWFSHPMEYTLFHRALGGDTLLVVSLQGAARVPLGAAERDSIARALRESASRLGYSGVIPRAADLPTHRRAIERIMVSDAGFLFVLPRVDGYSVGTVLDVFERSTGEYLGRVDLPIVLRGAARLFSGHLYASVPGELGVPRLVRLDFLDPA